MYYLTRTPPRQLQGVAPIRLYTVAGLHRDQGGRDDLAPHTEGPDQRWAYDLVVTREGKTFRGAGTDVRDYYSYGLPVLAPAAAIVFAAQDGEPDAALRGWRWGLAGLGNYVGLRGWRSAYFSQPILEGDRSLFSPAPSPLVPRQRAQSANSLGKWHARQDSNLRPSASVTTSSASCARMCPRSIFRLR